MYEKYKIITFGCQMNENDSEKISGMLSEMGYLESDDAAECSVIVINTCSVRGNADDKFFGALGQLKQLKQAKPETVICVCGCMMQQEVFRNEIKEKYRFVDIIFGTHNISEFPELLDRYKASHKKLVSVLEDTPDIPENVPTKRAFKHKAYVSIAFGCDNFCSYCIVPYTRGREKSRRPEDILKEVSCLAEDGCKEIMLLGQNVNSYGKGLDGRISFAELLSKVSDISGIERVRFMTSHPKDLSDELIDVIAERDNICNSIHLPVQSGSNRVLKLMNRHYTREHYISLVDKIRDRIPGVTISTDIIVGFPTETDEDFADTLDLVHKCAYDSAFTFIYSPRVGTKAASMELLPDEVIKPRFQALVDTLQEIIATKSQLYADTIQEVIVDGISRSNDMMMSGRTKSNKLVNFAGNCDIGDTVDVRITEAKPYYLLGEMLHD